MRAAQMNIADIKDGLKKLRYIFLWGTGFCCIFTIKGGWYIYHAYHEGHFSDAFLAPVSPSTTTSFPDLIYVSLCLTWQIVMIVVNLWNYLSFNVDKYFKSMKFPGRLFGNELSDTSIGRIFFISCIMLCGITVLMSETMSGLITTRLQR
jgi:hypothetical protein